MTRHYRVLCAGIALITLMVSGCSAPEQAGPTPPLAAPNTPDQHITGLTAAATGKVVLAQPVDLSFAISGQVVELAVQEGDVVQAGQVIARLDTTLADVEVDQAEAGLAVLQAELAKVQSGASEAEILEARSLATAVTYDWSISSGQRQAEQSAAQARLDYLLTQPFPENLALARARVHEAEEIVVMARTKRDQATLTAPIAGEVTQIFVHEYAYAASGQVVVQIGDVNHLHVEVTDIAEIDIARIAEDSSATITFEAFPGIKIPGTVTAILQSKGGLAAFVVVIDVEQFPQGVRPGMVAYVTIPIQ